MNEGTAIEIAEQKMKELGVGKEYIIRYRHLMLDAGEKKKIKGENHLYILVQPDLGIMVASKAGIYNMRDAGINEQQYIHRGQLLIESFLRSRIGVKFIQVIPKQKQEIKEQ